MSVTTKVPVVESPGTGVMAATFSPGSIPTKFTMARPLAFRARLGDLVDLLDVDLALVAEEEDEGVGGGDEELVHEVLFAGLHADCALAAALLRAVVVVQAVRLM